jgi:hypothetical protein
MGKLTSDQYRLRQHPDNIARIDNLVEDPNDGASTLPEIVGDYAVPTKGEFKGFTITDWLEWLIGSDLNNPDIIPIGASVAADIADTRAILAQPSIVEKNGAIEDGVDEIYETLKNKHLVQPYIGGATPCALLLIPLSPSSSLKLYAKEAGPNGEKIALTIEQATDPSVDLSLEVDGYVVTVTLPTDSAGDPIDVTATEFKALLEADSEFNALARIQRPEGLDEYTVPAMASANLDVVQGAAVRLISTAAEIDATVANTPAAGAPVMAAAASKILTIGTKPAEGATVTIGTTVYKFRATALGDGAKAACVLDLTADPPHDGDFVTLGSLTYTFKTALTPTAGEVLIEATSADSADNLVAAVSGGAGAGTKYATGTTASTDITVARVNNTMTVEYNVVGFLGNSFDTLTGNGEGPMTHGSFHATALHGGIDAQAAYDVYDGGDIENSIINLEKAIEDSGTEGTHYGTGTVAHPTVEVSAKDGTTLTATAKTKGVAGNSIALAETLADGSWAGGAKALSGGFNGTAAVAGKIMCAADAIWVATAECTITNSDGWKSAALS